MPVFQQLIDLNEMFNKLADPPIIINDLSNSSDEERKLISEIITTRYSSDMISLLPSCRCGATKGEFSTNIKCNYCGTNVTSQVENEVESSVWFRKPVGVNKLISPIIWIMLKARFKRSGFSIIQWLTDTTYRPNVKQPLVVNKIVDAGIQRSYNNFVDNFSSIMDFLFSLKEFQLKKNTVDYLKILIDQNKNTVFSDYIPLPNKSFLIIEKTNLGTYVDFIVIEAIDAIEMLVSIDKAFYDQNIRSKENRTAKAISKLSDFYEKFYKLNLSPKSGQFRKHIFGTRTNFSFRAVISSLTDTHEYDTIQVPWGVGLTAFRPHLINKLLKIGYDLNSAIGLLWGHVERYSPLLDSLLQELISESINKSIYVTIQRN